MTYHCLDNLEPAGVFRWFGEIAPTARGAHTPNEHLFISQVRPYWDLVLAVLAEKE